MITNFPKNKSYNLGGLRSFRFIRIGNILSLPPIVDGEITEAIQLMPGRDWLTGYSTPNALEFLEKGNDSPHGVFYDQAVNGFAPGDHKEMLSLVQSMEDQRFVVLAKDAQGQERLIGGYGYPLLFLSDFSTGSTRSDAKGFSYSFSGQSIFRAPIYKV